MFSRLMEFFINSQHETCRSFSSKEIQQLHHLNIQRNKLAIGDGFLRENRGVTMAFVAGLKEENCYCGFVMSVDSGKEHINASEVASLNSGARS